MNTPLITLTTDFGRRDSYVAQMKGEIFQIAADARIVDVTHEIPPQDLRRAAMVLSEVHDSFPAGTIHVAVVDPGVGSSRRLVAVEMAEQRFVGPDNGVFGLIAHEHRPRRIARLDHSAVWRAIRDEPPVSHTFHGRDILAPVAAHWSLGRDLTELGSLTTEALQVAPWPNPKSTNNGYHGEVIAIDHFGNLITNITRAMLEIVEPQLWSFELAGHTLWTLHRYYAEVPAGQPLALIGSSGLLEIAVRDGNAAQEHCAAIGMPVDCRRT